MEQKDLWEPQKSRLSRSEKYEWMGQPELSGTGLGTACGSGCGRPCARLCSAPRKSSEPSPATPVKTHTPLVSDYVQQINHFRQHRIERIVTVSRYFNLNTELQNDKIILLSLSEKAKRVYFLYI